MSRTSKNFIHSISIRSLTLMGVSGLALTGSITAEAFITAPPGCVITGQTLVCEGDVTDHVYIANEGDFTVNIGNPDTGSTANLDGSTLFTNPVYMYDVNGDQNINLNEGSTVTSGNGYTALFIRSIYGDVNINNSGDVFADWNGVYGGSEFGSVNIFSHNSTAALNAVVGYTRGLDLNIETSGTSTSDFGAGIWAGNSGFGNDGGVTILAGGLTQATNGTGIYAYNYGLRDLSVTALNDVIAMGNSGYYGNDGINVSNYYGGSILLDVGNVSSETQAGIYAYNGYETDSIRLVSDGLISGNWVGIDAFNDGTGSLLLDVADVTAVNGVAIYAWNSYNSMGNMSVNSSGLLEGRWSGLDAFNTGAGSLLIDVTDVTATDGTAIYAYNSNQGTDVSVATSGTVSGSQNGIWLENYGSGETIIAIGGDVTADEVAVYALSGTGTELSVAAGATVSGATGIETLGMYNSVEATDMLDIAGTVNGGIFTYQGDDEVTLAASSGVTGGVDLGTENDVLNLDTDDFDILIGGDGVDILNVGNSGGTLDADTITQFETYNFNGGGWTLRGVFSEPDEINFLAGDNILDGTIDLSLFMISSDAGLSPADGAVVTGDLVNYGTVDIADTASGVFTVEGNYSQTSMGSLVMDANSTTDHDLLVVQGTANLAGDLTVNQDHFVLGTVTLIDAGVLNGTFDTHNLAGSGLLLSNELEYDTANGDVNIIGTRADASSVAGLTSNQIAVGNALVDDFIGGMTSDDLGALALATGALSDVGNLSSTLEELHPEELIAGVEIFRNSQMIFTNSLMIHSGVSQEVAPTLLASNSGPMIDDDGLTDDHVWAAFQYMHSEQDGTQSGVDYESDGYDLTLGVSNLGNGSVRFGAAVSYGVMDSEVGGLGTDKVDSKMFRIGGHIRNDLNRSARGLRGHVDVVGSLGIGSNEIERNVTASAVSLAEIQTADPDIDGYNAYMRFTMDGANGRDWMIRPFVQGGFDGVKQDAVSFGSSAAALTTEEIDATRTTLGGGATFETTLGSNGYISLAGTGLFHQGDTDSAFSSRFNNTDSTGASFVTVGEDIKEQYIIDLSMGKLAKTGGLVFGLDGFVELGDLEGYGGRVRIGQRF